MDLPTYLKEEGDDKPIEKPVIVVVKDNDNQVTIVVSEPGQPASISTITRNSTHDN
jgi:hypothetical protein